MLDMKGIGGRYHDAKSVCCASSAWSGTPKAIDGCGANITLSNAYRTKNNGIFGTTDK